MKDKETKEKQDLHSFITTNKNINKNINKDKNSKNSSLNEDDYEDYEDNN